MWSNDLFSSISTITCWMLSCGLGTRTPVDADARAATKKDLDWGAGLVYAQPEIPTIQATRSFCCCPIGTWCAATVSRAHASLHHQLHARVPAKRCGPRRRGLSRTDRG